MKILYIGVFREQSGWGQAAIDYILSLDSVGVDIVPRAVKLNNASPTLPPRILELEACSSHGCDIVIQHVLPHHLDYNGHFRRNIALYSSETSNFRDSVWADRLNTMDAAIVTNKQMLTAARASGVIIDIGVVPQACNVERFMQSYQPLEVLKSYRDSGDFVFYFIGEMTRRKNLSALLRAFHTEFDPSEPVQLVIKTSQPGTSPQALANKLQSWTNEIKEDLKLHGGRVDFYKKEIFHTTRLSDFDMMRLHSACDCFVMPSYGEGWSLGAFDSMAMGKTPIATACTGFLEYLSDAEGWLVPANQEPVFGATDTFTDLFTANESWWSIDINLLRKAMREAYSNERLRNEKAIAGVKRAHDFSYQVIGEKLREMLEHGELA